MAGDPHLSLEIVVEAAAQGHCQKALLLMDHFGFDFKTLHDGHSLLVQIIFFGAKDLVLWIIKDLNLCATCCDLTDSSGINPVAASVLRTGQDREVLEALLDRRFSAISSLSTNSLCLANNLCSDLCKSLLQWGIPLTGITQIGPFWLKEWFRAAGFEAEGDQGPSGILSLKLICRRVVRRQCKKSEHNFFRLSLHLGLPKKLGWYILWGELLDEQSPEVVEWRDWSESRHLSTWSQGPPKFLPCCLPSN